MVSDVLWKFENDWKILSSVVCRYIFSIALNFSWLCDAYTMFRKFTALPKIIRIYFLLLGIILKNCILIFLNEIEVFRILICLDSNYLLYFSKKMCQHRFLHNRNLNNVSLSSSGWKIFINSAKCIFSFLFMRTEYGSRFWKMFMNI